MMHPIHCSLQIIENTIRCEAVDLYLTSSAWNIAFLRRERIMEDEEFEATYEELCFITTLLAVFSVFGSAGNALVLYVFSTAKDDLVSTLFIIVLAVVDSITCIVIIPFTIVVELVSYEVRFDLLCKLYQFLITSNIPFSALIMTAIAVDRYFCICHPFARLLTLRRARVVVLVLAAFATVLGILGSLTHSVYRRVRADTNATEHGIVTQSTVTLPVAWDNQSQVLSNETVYTGYCSPTDLILSTQFTAAFQLCYTTLFVVCLGVIVVLYSVIYRSVIRQRRKLQKMKSAPIKSHASRVRRTTEETTPMTGNPATAVIVRSSSAALHRDNADEGSVCLELSPEAVETVCESPAAVVGPANDDRSRADVVSPTVNAAAVEAARRNRIANIKTAGMLFVVTLVFTVSFLPSLAMTVYLLPYNITIFYMYFANNVANPIIYSFMNSNFRKLLVRLFCKSSWNAHGS